MIPPTQLSKYLPGSRLSETHFFKAFSYLGKISPYIIGSRYFSAMNMDVGEAEWVYTTLGYPDTLGVRHRMVGALNTGHLSR